MLRHVWVTCYVQQYNYWEYSAEGQTNGLVKKIHEVCNLLQDPTSITLYDCIVAWKVTSNLPWTNLRVYK
jgi:hypothetical protein